MELGKKGFTLIELIIVIVIIGILASITGPMMGNVKVKAICAEAVSAMGAIRETLREYRVTNGKYPTFEDFLVNDANLMKDLGLTEPGIKGTYFGSNCYYLILNNDDFDCIQAVPRPDDSGYGGTLNNAVKHTEAESMVDADGAYLQMSLKTGKIIQSNIKGSGY